VCFLYKNSYCNDISHKNDTIKTDTISGVFLYEVNVPERCYSRMDQIEQGNNFIWYDNQIKKKTIGKLYQRGVIVLNYDNSITNFEKQSHLVLAQKQKSIDSFLNAFNYFSYHNNAQEKTLVYDKSGKLSYRKLRAKFIVVELGDQQQLVPMMKQYTCCYANRQMPVRTFFIIDIVSYNFY